MRDHLFISYASEDGALADWLVRRLTAEGYRVWCDRFKLLGGERWPKDIDHAIKTRTFRMLALLSVHSLDKENPVKERQLALELSRQRGENFLVPLNLDGRRATDLNWQLSDIQFIPFHEWAAGLQQLLRLLRSLDTPRPIVDAGPSFAAETFLPASVLLPKREPLNTNVYLVERTPDSIREFTASRDVSYDEAQSVRAYWAFYRVNETRFLSFWPPRDSLLPNLTFDKTAIWLRSEEGKGPNLADVSTHLLRRSLSVRAVERGLAVGADGGTLYFPPGLISKELLWYRDYNNKKQRVYVAGERKFGAARTRYHLAVSFHTRSDVTVQAAVLVRVRLEIADAAGTSLSAKARNARRKKITKSWWNHEWLARQLAIMQYLANGERSIVIGESPDEVSISGAPLVAEVTPSLSDHRLKHLKSKVLASMATLDVESDDEDDTAETDSGEA